MPKYIFTSKWGELVLGIGDKGVPYALKRIEGTSPVDAQINMTQMAKHDGAIFNSSKVGTRTINVAIAITADAEASRQALYKIFRPKDVIKIAYKSDMLDIWTEGYVASSPVPLMDNKQVMTVQIICPDPYWRSAEEIIDKMNSIIKAFHFPFAITEDDPIPISYSQALTNKTVVNEGAANTGLVMRLHAKGSVSNPKIWNYITSEFFGLDYSMATGDIITVDGTAGHKTVTLTRGGTDTNIFNYIMQGSTWLELEQGENVFTYEVTGDASLLDVEFVHYDTYTGV